MVLASDENIEENEGNKMWMINESLQYILIFKKKTITIDKCRQRLNKPFL